jgi:FkbM family methyltransferase
MKPERHTFDNGVMVYKKHCTAEQLQRYAICNVHEADEEDHFTKMVEAMPTGGVFVNVGAAVGYYAILAARLRGDIRVECFEPLPMHVECLRDNLDLNNVPRSRVGIHPEAISIDARSIALSVDSFSSRVLAGDSSSSKIQLIRKRVRELFRGSGGGRTITVPGIPLSGICARLARPSIDLLQMDIQGHEAEVLSAFFMLGPEEQRKSPINAFLIGTHGPAVHKRCLDLLTSNGYLIELDQPLSEVQPDGILAARYSVSAG